MPDFGVDGEFFPFESEASCIILRLCRKFLTGGATSQTRKNEKNERMQGTGTTYAYSGETTEWEDILIKKGITTKENVLLSKGLNPADVSFLENVVLFIGRYHFLNIYW